MGVARTRREEPARRWPPVRRALVPVDRRQQPGLHAGRGTRLDRVLGLARVDGRAHVRGARMHGAHLDAGSRSSIRSNSDAKLIERQFGSGGLSADQQQARGQRRRPLAGGQQFPQPAAKSVAGDGGTEGASDRERRARRRHQWIGKEVAPQRRAVDPRTVTTEAFERVALADPVRQADRRARPLARRFLSTARPARVLIRARKPCLRARRRLLGWNVRFNVDLLDGLVTMTRRAGQGR